MKTRPLILAITVLLALRITACSSVSVNQDFDPSYDFTSLKTYSWMPITVPASVGELKAKRFKSAVDTQLGAMGYREVAEDASFLINVHSSRQQKVDVTSYGYGYGRWGMYGAGGVEVDTYEEGTLMLDFIDGGTKEMFWRGTANAIVDPNASMEAQQARFQEVAEKLLAQFPPR